MTQYHLSYLNESLNKASQNWSFVSLPPPFFLKVSKKKLRGFPKLRGFQKSVKGVQKYRVFTLKVESFSSDTKTCSLLKLRSSRKLRGIYKKEDQCPKQEVFFTAKVHSPIL